MSKYKSYRDILKNVYEIRKRKNPSYSMVAFSRDCGFKSYHVSDVLSGRYPLSIKRAHDVSKKLKFNDLLHEEFIALVNLEHSKDQIRVQQAIKTLKKAQSDSVVIINDNDFSLISDWYYLAIVEIYRNEKNQKLGFLEISEKLNIDKDLALNAINKLVEQNYLCRLSPSGYKANKEYIAIRASNKSSEIIRNFHKQILSKVVTSIDSISSDKRHIQTFVALLSEKDYKLFVDDLSQFIKQRIEELQETKSSGVVHSIGFQILPLEKI